MRRAPAILIVLLAACGGGGESTGPGNGGGGGGGTPAAVASVTIGGAPSGSLTVGATAALTATARDAGGNALSGRAVSWTSSDANVASVDGGGTVRGVAPGAAQITATVEGRTASVSIVVAAPVPASIELARGTSYLVAGDTMRITARVLDAGGQQIANPGTVAFTTSNAAVATVNGSGDVTAVGPGTATITATLGTLTRTAALTVVAGAGQRVASMSAIDSAVIEGMKRLGIPGAQVAITRDDRLVFSRAYGWADTAAKRPVALNTMFRVGSTSKPLTAVAIMKLVQDGRLSLDDKVFTVLNTVTPVAGRTEDPRVADLTVRHLLSHTQGYNANREVDDSTWRYVSRDRIFDYTMLARLGRSTKFVGAPGAAYAYNNFGYILLGRVLEKVTGKSYEAAVRELILDPAGVPAAMQLGRTQLSLRHPLEATCYDSQAPVAGVYGTGKWCDVMPEQEYAEASGQWVASATDMVRWLSVVNGVAGRADILNAATVTAMLARPTSYPYALGWGVTGSGATAEWSHSGAQRGGDGFVLRRADGVGLVVLANLTRNLAPAGQELDAAVRQALNGVTSWPTGTAF